VIHCHQQHVVASSISALVGRLGGRKVFVSDLGGGGWDISAYLSTDRWYHGHLHISQYSRQVLGHSNSRKAQVILGGVDSAKFSPGETEQDREIGPAVYVGRILPHKGIDYLVEAAEAGSPVRVVGRPYNDQYMRTLRELAAGKPVEFVH